MIDRLYTKRQLLYRSASTEALIRERDVLAFEAQKPARGVKKRGNFDVRALRNKDVSAQLDSQRSVFLEDDYEQVVKRYSKKQEELHRYHDEHDVPDMERVLNEKDLKIVVRMTNHNYTSVNDVFEKSGPDRFKSDREKAFMLKDQQKRERLKLSMPKRVPGREIISGYQKKVFVSEKYFHEDLLRNEFEPSDED